MEHEMEGVMNEIEKARHCKMEYGTTMFMDDPNKIPMAMPPAHDIQQEKPSPSIMTPVEKDHQGTGPGWNTTRPKAGK